MCMNYSSGYCDKTTCRNHLKGGHILGSFQTQFITVANVPKQEEGSNAVPTAPQQAFSFLFSLSPNLMDCVSHI